MAKKLVLLLVLCSAVPFIMAPGTPPPPPENDCSPGYYKNHTEVWMPMECGADYNLSNEILLDMLTPQGTLGDKQDRETAKFILDNCVGVVADCKD